MKSWVSILIIFMCCIMFTSADAIDICISPKDGFKYGKNNGIIKIHNNRYYSFTTCQDEKYNIDVNSVIFNVPLPCRLFRGPDPLCVKKIVWGDSSKVLIIIFTNNKSEIKIEKVKLDFYPELNNYINRLGLYHEKGKEVKLNIPYK